MPRRLGDIYRDLLNSSEQTPVVLNKSDIPLRLRGRIDAHGPEALSVMFSTPDNKLHWRETPDTWVLWLVGPPHGASHK